MPFADEFDDVHAAIKAAVAVVREPNAVQCTRLDDDQRGGRIIERLEQELRDCDMCVADVSGNRCNVMWEVGFAMALNKPVILVSHGDVILHFDLHDVQHVKYQRAQLRRTLTEPLATAISHTARNLVAAKQQPVENAPDRLEKMDAQMHELRDMVQQLVQQFVKPSLAPSPEPLACPIQLLPDTASDLNAAAPATHARRDLEGTWFNLETDSHIYVQFIDDQLIAPYCYGGNNSLTGVYHSLQAVGDFLHARFEWIHEPLHGFSFLRAESNDLLTGAWWLDDEHDPTSVTMPTLESGAQSSWKRVNDARTPNWATEFFKLAQSGGLQRALAQLRRA